MFYIESANENFERAKKLKHFSGEVRVVLSSDFQNAVRFKLLGALLFCTCRVPP